MAHLVEEGSAVYAEKPAWHGVGVTVPESFTTEQALKLGNFDYHVSKTQIYIKDRHGHHDVAVPNQVAVIREDTHQILGITSDKYEPFQNIEAIRWADNLLQDGVAHWESMMVLDGGKKFAGLMKLEEDMRVGDEDYWQYFLISTGHDGKYAIHLLPTNVRVVCYNTLTAATQSKYWTTSKASFQIRHNTNMRTNLDIARDSVQITTAANRRMKEWLEKALVTDLTASREKDILNHLFGDPEKEDMTNWQKNQRNNFVTQFLDEEYDRNGETSYSFLQAATGYADHGIPFNKREAASVRSQSERRFSSSLVSGRGDQIKKKTFAALDALGVGS
tara:strand:- start:1728 stop:2726 length:999 start_codon:yes stop_codon:yes gene_type:complete